MWRVLIGNKKTGTCHWSNKSNTNKKKLDYVSSYD